MKKIIVLLLILFSVWQVSYAQVLNTNAQLEVSGLVLDEAEEPMIGATVYIKDKTGGIMTDADGTFKLKASKGDVLVVSMVGYKKYEYLIVESQRGLRVKLEPSTEVLDEVVVTGREQRNEK